MGHPPANRRPRNARPPRATGAARPPWARRTVAVLAGAYLALLAYATLTPADTASSVTGVVGLLAASVATALATDPDATYAVAEVAANVALFTPFGMLVAAPRAPARAIALLASASVGAATSLAIELAQRGIDGRVSTMVDVAANTAGAVLGAVAIVVLANVRARRARVTTARTP